MISHDLEIATLEDAIVAPIYRDSGNRVNRGGVINHKGEVEKQSLLYRNFSQIIFPPSSAASVIETCDEEHIFAGFLFNHFGHFILESLARVWAVRQVSNSPIVWATDGELNAWQREICETLGFANRVRTLKGPTRFKKLLLPDVGYRSQDYIHPNHAKFLGAYSRSQDDEKGPPLWLSRSALRGKQTISGEGEFEQALKKRGWDIVHPEQLSITKQLALIAKASVVAGVEGSALHAVVLVDQLSGPLVVFRRLFNQNYRTIASVKNIVQYDFIGAIGRSKSLIKSDLIFVSAERSASMLDEVRQRHQNDACNAEAVSVQNLPKLSIYQDDVEQLTSLNLSNQNPGLNVALNFLGTAIAEKIRRTCRGNRLR